MPKTVEIKDLLKLSAKKRAAIAEAMLESLYEDGPPPGPEDAELKRRIEDFRQNPNQKLLTLDELRKALGWAR